MLEYRGMVLKLPRVRKLLTLLSFLLLTIAIAFSVPPSRAEELDDVTADLARQQQQSPLSQIMGGGQPPAGAAPQGAPGQPPQQAAA